MGLYVKPVSVPKTNDPRYRTAYSTGCNVLLIEKKLRIVCHEFLLIEKTGEGLLKNRYNFEHAPIIFKWRKRQLNETKFEALPPTHVHV